MTTKTQPITEQNIEETLIYHGYKFHSDRIYTGSVTSIRYFKEINNMFYFKLAYPESYIYTENFEECLQFMQKRIDLKELPVKEEFDCEKYLYNHNLSYSIDGKYLFISTAWHKSLFSLPLMSFNKINMDRIIVIADIVREFDND
jgi:hypothetical protein